MALAVLNRSTATRRRFLALLACLLLSAIVPPARADVLYSNPPDLGVTQNGLCFYNTACSVNTFVAQPFALTQLSTVTGAGFNSVVRNALFAPDANWMILASPPPSPSPAPQFPNRPQSPSSAPPCSAWARHGAARGK